MSLEDQKYITIRLHKELLDCEDVQEVVTDLLQRIDIEKEPVGFTIPGLTVFIASTIEARVDNYESSEIEIEEVEEQHKTVFKLNCMNFDKIKNEKRFINDLIYCILNKENKKTNEYTLKIVEA